jgi:anti-sigma B factor antagonist
MERRLEQRRKVNRRSGLDRRRGPVRGPDRRISARRSGFDRRILDIQMDNSAVLIPVLLCTGRITIGSPTENLVAKCSELLEVHPVIALDLRGVIHIDSTGVEALLSILASARARNRNLSLIAPSPLVDAALRVTSLQNLFQVFANAEEASKRWLPSC